MRGRGREHENWKGHLEEARGEGKEGEVVLLEELQLTLPLNSSKF